MSPVALFLVIFTCNRTRRQILGLEGDDDGETVEKESEQEGGDEGEFDIKLGEAMKSDFSKSNIRKEEEEEEERAEGEGDEEEEEETDNTALKTEDETGEESEEKEETHESLQEQTRGLDLASGIIASIVLKNALRGKRRLMLQSVCVCEREGV